MMYAGCNKKKFYYIEMHKISSILNRYSVRVPIHWNGDAIPSEKPLKMGLILILERFLL